MRYLLAAFVGLLFGASTPAFAQADELSVAISWEAPTIYLPGSEFDVHVELRVPEGGAAVAGWILTPSAFSVDGKPIAERPAESALYLASNAVLRLDFDLGPYMEQTRDFNLEFAAGVLAEDPLAVRVLRAAPRGLAFMDEPLAKLPDYHVVLQTNVGNVRIELWPEVAPQHVRNFLDLAYTGFYDGVVFHRVLPGFVVQGGDPTGSGVGAGPRTLRAELSDRRHERGVLSMARGKSLDSASCQFFVVLTDDGASHLDRRKDPASGKMVGFTTFGRVISGMEVIDAIAETPCNNQRPLKDRVILKAHVVRAED